MVSKCLELCLVIGWVSEEVRKVRRVCFECNEDFDSQSIELQDCRPFRWRRLFLVSCCKGFGLLIGRGDGLRQGINVYE